MTREPDEGRSELSERPVESRSASPAQDYGSATNVADVSGSAYDSLGRRASGNVVAQFELQEPLGVGGMGVVYRARDRRLERTVALKFISRAVSEEPQAKARFLAEARAAAALEHPNICTVHEIGETPDGQLYIAMAFVDGPTLRQLVEEGPLPMEKAVDIARQIAAGLERAHESGVVHRDVKPANVIVGRDGVVKLVDFGVAKLAGLALTRTGVAPGTPAYMSPEQAGAEEIDHRTDLWSLGVVLYEILTGTRPFPGETDLALLSQIMTAEPPPIGTLRPDVPVELERLVSRALEKSPGRRFQSASEMRQELSRLAGPSGSDAHALGPRSVDVASSRAGSPKPSRGLRVPRPWLTSVGLLLLAGTGIGTWTWLSGGSSVPGQTLRVSISSPGVVTPQLSAAISPDGRQIAFVATEASGPARMWVRTLDQLEARPVPNTERAAHPFWSPDGRSIGFIADNQLKRVDLADGRVQTLADTLIRAGPAWGPDGTILFSRSAAQLVAVPSDGGAARTILEGDSANQLTSILWPRFLPDGRRFVFIGTSRQPGRRGIYVGSLDSNQTTFLLQSDFRAWYAPQGYLLYARDEAVVAQRFDPERLALRDDPIVIADGVWGARTAGQASFSVSETGALAYVNASLWDGELSWFDRAGRPLGSAAPPTRYEGQVPQISPDGRRVAVARGELGRQLVWVLEAPPTPAVQHTSTSGTFVNPVWGRDSRSLLFTLGGRLLVKDTETGSERVVLDSVPGTLQDWSLDGNYAVFTRTATRAQILAVRLDGDGLPLPFLQTPYNTTQPQLSPSGRWIAYTSNESGRDEVYVQSFPQPGRKRRVSADGGAMPRWRRDGTELFYVAANQFLTAVPVLDAASMELGPGTQLFRTRLVVEGSESTDLPTRYDAAPDGQRFLLRYPPVDPGPPITIVLNWPQLLTSARSQPN
jgi:serine/threonine protein kinase/dipeptidyl aminopeptidase/acylaminoacyl peptidase